ncbi:ATP-binding cassette domain-containing protein [[Mycoplasma] testudinis]|uniref:ATP-binding cassette domain-containing protein n=1 Tax=[Mycoplasma] testudinis TaxID=33924 RepID=UPI0004806129|nr:ABC transporter ATP-binding protein [[Mycoplasma] testudinis]
MIKINNLTVKFGHRTILDDVNLQFDYGDRIAILGKNGSGKTTFIETIMGLNKPTSGSIKIAPELASHMKAVFQDIGYDAELTLKELLYFYGMISKTKKFDNSVFDKYELGHVKNKIFKQLSGGEKQKFKLLLCMEFNPSLIILDELTTSLDYQWRMDIVDKIEDYLKLNPHSILLLVSHDPVEIRALCNKYYLVKDQKINKIDDIDNLFERRV